MQYIETATKALKLLHNHCVVPFEDLDAAMEIRTFISAIAVGKIVCLTTEQIQEAAAGAKDRETEKHPGGDNPNKDGAGAGSPERPGNGVEGGEAPPAESD